ncbi:hypothetical protein [Brachybacterium sp. GPGPB12]|uniref:hypothetical protein n=1 Tax=Brachybacterium sp. GPGPB12 TaxID=3023517 RepID=UPI0031342302
MREESLLDTRRSGKPPMLAPCSVPTKAGSAATTAATSCTWRLASLPRPRKPAPV